MKWRYCENLWISTELITNEGEIYQYGMNVNWALELFCKLIDIDLKYHWKHYNSAIHSQHRCQLQFFNFSLLTKTIKIRKPLNRWNEHAMKYVFNRFDVLEHAAILLIFVEIKWIRYSWEPFIPSRSPSPIQSTHPRFILRTRSITEGCIHRTARSFWDCSQGKTTMTTYKCIWFRHFGLLIE